jgi:hypothetical protein
MKKLHEALIPLVFLFTSACSDPNAPPSEMSVAPPEWAHNLQGISVNKRSAYVNDSEGHKIRVEQSGTDIGNGLIATRDKWDLYVTDGQGVKCNWNSYEELKGCTQPNPAYQTYINSLQH